jgi:hypothetical protein
MNKKVCDLDYGDLVKTINGIEEILGIETCYDSYNTTTIITKSGKYDINSNAIVEIFNCGAVGKGGDSR